MCFQNQISYLEEFRSRKRSIRVWKTGSVSKKTGRVTTKFTFYKKGTHKTLKVEWIKGKVARPHQILKPLRKGEFCSAGLYFHTGEPPTNRMGLVIARVKPEDIIGVDNSGTQICCVAAKVIEAPDPDQRLMRMNYLRTKVLEARGDNEYRNSLLKEWEAAREDRQEALLAMADELEELQESETRSTKKEMKNNVFH